MVFHAQTTTVVDVLVTLQGSSHWASWGSSLLLITPTETRDNLTVLVDKFVVVQNEIDTLSLLHRLDLSTLHDLASGLGIKRDVFVVLKMASVTARPWGKSWSRFFRQSLSNQTFL
jgi:hypothetical protein